MEQIKCTICTKEFSANKNYIKDISKVTCSKECREKRYKLKNPNTKCVICDKSIYRIPSRIIEHTTCSKACRNKWFSKEKHPRWVGGSKNKNKARIADKTRKIKYKLKAIKELGGKCNDCGYEKCIAALDFHHIDPLSKDDTIKDISSGSWKRIEKEIKKCILLCANCHRTRHWNEQSINISIMEQLSKVV